MAVLGFQLLPRYPLGHKRLGPQASDNLRILHKNIHIDGSVVFFVLNTDFMELGRREIPIIKGNISFHQGHIKIEFMLLVINIKSIDIMLLLVIVTALLLVIVVCINNGFNATTAGVGRTEGK